MSSSPKPELRLDWCSHKAAKYAVEHWHYSRCLPASKSAYLWVWEDQAFVGVVAFGTGAGNITLGKLYGLAPMQMCELTRVALGTHATPTSRVVAVALRLIASANPGLRLIVSLADPVRGHVGGIYQAGGWRYVGETAKSKTYIDALGVEHHERVCSPSGRKRQYGRYVAALKPSDAATIRHNPGKHKYLMPLDEEMRQRIAPLAKPYPKRPKDQAPAVHAGLGGETPTRPLQSSEAHP